MKLAQWAQMPSNVRNHLEDRLRDRTITLADLQKLRFWIDSEPDIPEGDWFKDFHTFILCGTNEYPTTFLASNMKPWGTEIF